MYIYIHTWILFYNVSICMIPNPFSQQDQPEASAPPLSIQPQGPGSMATGYFYGNSGPGAPKIRHVNREITWFD